MNGALKFLMAVVLAVCFLVLPFLARAQTSPAYPAEFDVSVTTGTLTIAAGAIQVADVPTVLRINQSDVTDVIIAVQSLSDGSASTTATLGLKFFSTAPAAGDMDGSTPAKTGIPLAEGDTIYLRCLDRYLGFRGEVGTSRVRAWQVEQEE